MNNNKNACSWKLIVTVVDFFFILPYKIREYELDKMLGYCNKTISKDLSYSEDKELRCI